MKDKIIAWISDNKGAAIGILLGIVFAILIFTINFWRTLLLVILIAVGYALGRMSDKGQSLLGKIAAFFDRLLK